MILFVMSVRISDCVCMFVPFGLETPIGVHCLRSHDFNDVPSPSGGLILSSQGFISESAIKKAAEAGPDGTATFIVRLTDAVLTPEEVETLRELGMVEYLPFFMTAMVVVPGRCLLEIAELESVVAVA